MLMASFCVETVLFGYNTKIYHITNIILYIFSFYLIYMFFLKLKLNRNVSKFICLLFTVHPILSSNVVYISPRAEMLLTCFLMLSIINFINYIQMEKLKNLILFFLFFLFALLSKETAVIFIVILALFVYCFNYHFSKKQIENVAVFILLALIIYVLFRPNTSNFANLKTVFINAINSLSIFNYKICFPEYIPVLLYGVKISLKLIFFNFILLCFIVFVFLQKTIIDRKKFLFCLLWYLLFLIPNFFIVERQIFFHRLLLPLVGIEIFMILLTNYIITKYISLKNFLVVIFMFLFITFFYASLFQAEKYRSSENFMINSYIDSQNRISYSQFIDYCIGKGDLKKAREILEKVSREKLTYRNILYYAKIEFYEGNLDKAEEIAINLEKAIKNEKVYKLLSMIYLSKKDFDKAFDYLNKFKSIVQHDIWIEIQTANIYENLGNFEKALNIYESLLKFYKNNKEYENKVKKLKEKIENRGNINA